MVHVKDYYQLKRFCVVALPEALISLDLAERCFEHALHCSSRASSILFDEFSCSHRAQQSKNSARVQGAVLQERKGMRRAQMYAHKKQYRLQLMLPAALHKQTSSETAKCMLLCGKLTISSHTQCVSM
jgi:hypothetical protein